MDFKTATDRLAGRVTIPEIAAACGVSENLIVRARQESGSASFRNPPQGWEKAVARLARERGDELHGLAEELEGG